VLLAVWVFEEAPNVARAVQDGQHGQGATRRVVNDQVRKHAPELHGALGEILAGVPHFGHLGELPKGVEGIQNTECGIDILLGDEVCDASTCELASGVSW
jgi:hypothetical protein